MWCSKLILAPLLFARNVNPSFLIPLKSLEISSPPPPQCRAGEQGMSPSLPPSQPQGGLSHVPPRAQSPPWGCPITVCCPLAHFSPPWVPVWCQLERDALLALRGQPHSAAPQHPLPHAGVGSSALHRSMPPSGCFLVPTGPLALDNCFHNSSAINKRTLCSSRVAEPWQQAGGEGSSHGSEAGHCSGDRRAGLVPSHQPLLSSKGIKGACFPS